MQIVNITAINKITITIEIEVKTNLVKMVGYRIKEAL